MGIIAPEHIFVDSDERDVALEAWYGECRAQIAYYSPNGDYLFILKAFHLATSIRRHIKCTCWYSWLEIKEAERQHRTDPEHSLKGQGYHYVGVLLY